MKTKSTYTELYNLQKKKKKDISTGKSGLIIL